VETPTAKSPFAIRNIRLFIAFRVFFNSRFYYPVFTILFLDFGLTLEQFALLNAAWAAAIVLFEVPSGALADILGRRRLMVTSAVLMVIEIGLLCFVPRENARLLLAVFLINRLLSGAAEAAASGADEALAYDSLKAAGNVENWPQVLERQMRVQSMAYVLAMSVGAAVYDPKLMQRLVDLLGWKVALTQEITLRFPLYLTLVMAIFALISTLLMQEEPAEQIKPSQEAPSVRAAFGLTLSAGVWILRTPFALVVILAGLLFDSCIRMIITLNSQYFRLIQLPEATFGLIGSGLAMLGLFIPRLAMILVKRSTPLVNFTTMMVATVLGLVGITFFWPIFGLIPIALLFGVVYLQRFFESHYLNRITQSYQRATVLSFKGLSFNLAYGFLGLLYSLLLALLHYHHPASRQAVDPENLVFMRSMAYFPWYFLLTAAGLVLFARRQLRRSAEYNIPG
jgi:MFS family permease